mmetsp:Transcript_42988/g.135807  ORF Transcript_42988/g.135807 Transcript_42988/m.135807 type:complete len:491 (+) Transcript_42988:940-2412(+)
MEFPQYNASKAQDILSFHKLHGWLDVNSRLVRISATFFNPSLQLCLFMSLTAEMPPFGGLVTSSSFIALPLKMYQGVTGVFKLIFQLLFCAIELKFLFDEYLAAKELGFEYIKRFWGWVRLIECGLIAAIAAIRISSLSMVDQQYANLNTSSVSSTYIDLQRIPRLTTSDNNLVVALSILLFARLFKYATFYDGADHLFRVVARALLEVVPFFVFFSIVFIMYTLGCYTLFGDKSVNFRSFTTSVQSMMFIMMGDSSVYKEMAAIDDSLTPLLVYSFLTVQFVLCLNMFTAIMVHTHARVKSELDKEPEDAFREQLDGLIKLLRRSLGKVEPEENEEIENELEDEIARVSSDAQDGRAEKEGRGGERIFNRIPSNGSNYAEVIKAAPMLEGGDNELSSIVNRKLQRIESQLTSLESVKLNVLALSDRLNALTEFLVSDPSRLRSSKQIDAISRKLDILSETLAGADPSARPSLGEMKEAEVTVEESDWNE